MKPVGLSLIFLSLLPPLFWLTQFGGEQSFSVLISQYAGMISLISMALVQVMATRFRGVEALFGPLDQVYVLHKWLAVLAIVAAFLHDTIEAEPTLRNAAGALIKGEEDGIAGELGEIGFYGILILGLGSLATFIPYNIWRWTHRLIGVFFALAAVHFLLISNFFSWSNPLGLYISAFCFAGVSSFVHLTYKGIMGHTKAYEVETVEVYGRVTTVSLKPSGKPISHKAGQFAYVSFEQDGLRETHPYTIASAPQENGSIRFCISALGDYTSRVHELKTGAKAQLSRGYGGFKPFAQNLDQIWIAGGVGITPFLAWAQALSPGATGQIYLYYGVRNRLENPFEEEFEALQNRLPNLHVQYFESDMGEYIDARLLKILQGTSFDMMSIAFCGPEMMRMNLIAGLNKLNYPMRKFHYEEFEMRSDIGFGWLIKFLIRQFFKHTGKLAPAK